MAPIEEQLQTHARALRSLARALVGEAAADDLLQDAAVEALTAPPVRPGPLGGWFASVLRHLASKHRRGESRRQRRERQAARPEALPAADVEAAARDQLQRLSAAVLELPQPYQGVLLRRYLQEQAPAAIAAATGVPLATVKSQLQRGLGLLRERLARGGGDWRVGLAAAFALRPAAAAMVPVTGVVVMTGAGKIVGVAAAAAVLAVSVWWLRGSEPGVSSTSDAPAAPPATVAAAAAQRLVLPPAPTTDGGRSALFAALPEPATLRGRCVDAGGAALAGCRVVLNGAPANSDEMERWVRQHYDPQWDNPPAQQTGADGRFEFRFVPHEPLCFLVSARREGLVEMRANWTSRLDQHGITPGAVIDLGDIALQAGMQAHGRVTDDAKAPVAGIHVGLQRRTQGWQRVADAARPQPLGSAVATTDANGLFVIAPLPPGSYLLTCGQGDGLLAAEPKVCELLEPSPWLELQLQRSALTPSVRGRVVDELGAPVAGAGVRVPGTTLSARTRADGTFALFDADRRRDAPAQLQIVCSGFEPAEQMGPFAWGTEDLRIILRHGVDIALQVVDAQGRPVEDFAAWLWFDGDDPGQRGRTPAEERARTYGRHRGGEARLAGVRRGPHRLFVEPRAAQLTATSLQRIDVRGDSPMPLRVELPPAAERPVRVVDCSGAPVAGTQVELLEAVQAEATPELEVLPIESLVHRLHVADTALLRQQATTDANGETVLRGPAGGRYAVRVPGPRNLPAFVADVWLDDPSPLVVTVLRGGTLQVALTPDGVVAALRSYAALGDRAMPVYEPKLELVPTGLQPPTGVAHAAAFGRDGKAELTGVQPGRWQLRIAACTRSTSDPLGALMANHWQLPLGEVELADGETKPVRFDLPQLLPAELRGRVLHNGLPMAKARLQLSGLFDPELGDHHARDRTCSVTVLTDADGAFATIVRPGRYTVVAIEPRNVAADQVVPIAPGQHAEPTFTLRSGELRVRFADAAGKPVPDCQATLIDDHGAAAFSLARSAADGTSTTTVAAGTFTLIARGIGDGPQAADRLPLGELTVQPGACTRLERTLPDAWLHR